MFKTKRKTKDGAGKIAFIPYVLISLVVILVLSFAMAFVANLTSNPTANIGIYSLGALLISGAVCGFCISRAKGDGGVLTVLLVSLAVAVFMLVVALIAGGGKLSLGSFMNYGCYIGVAVLFSYFGKKRERRPKRHH